MPGYDWSDTLGEMPEAVYWGFEPQFGRSPNQKRFFQNQFANVQNRFMGLGARQMMGGETPTQTFPDFLTQYFAPGGGAARQWGGMSPGQRGMNFRQFAPPTRWTL